jgi:lysophospholipase L1-like esterase
LIVSLRRRAGRIPIVLAGVPPMSRFPALPRPLRDVLGARSAILDAAAARLTLLPSVVHVPMPAAMLDPATFAEDRFHPGPEGYRRWAEQLADVSLQLLSDTDQPQNR